MTKFLLLAIFSLRFVSAYEVLVLAEPVIDRNCLIDMDTLNRLHLDKGESRLIDGNILEQHSKSFFQNGPIALAGSGMNVVKGLAKLGHNCAAIGTIGEDGLGLWIEKEMNKLKIYFIHRVIDIPTTQCLCFITPDKERTMLTYMGASKHTQEEMLNPKDFENLKFFHLEGYQIFQESIARSALALAKQNGATISINLATPYLAKAKQEAYLDMIQRYANIVFCNEAEALAISDQPTAELACEWLASHCDICVVTQGSQGGILHSHGQTIRFQAKPVDVKDTTGAGDLFSSGFIHAFLKNKSLEQCLMTGRDVAAQVVSVFGVDIPDQTWEILKTTCD